MREEHWSDIQAEGKQRKLPNKLPYSQAQTFWRRRPSPEKINSPQNKHIPTIPEWEFGSGILPSWNSFVAFRPRKLEDEHLRGAQSFKARLWHNSMPQIKGTDLSVWQLVGKHAPWKISTPLEQFLREKFSPKVHSMGIHQNDFKNDFKKWFHQNDSINTIKKRFEENDPKENDSTKRFHENPISTYKVTVPRRYQRKTYFGVISGLVPLHPMTVQSE